MPPPPPPPHRLHRRLSQTLRVNYAVLRRWLMGACFLLTPLAMLTWGTWFALRPPGHGFDITHWALLGAFNGFFCGGILALILRLVISIVDNAKEQHDSAAARIVSAGVGIVILVALALVGLLNGNWGEAARP